MFKVIYIIIFCLVLLAQFACPQTSRVSNSARVVVATEKSRTNYPSLTVQAKEVAKATKDNDWETLIDLTHPRVIERAGGRQAMSDSLRRAADELGSWGSELLSTEVGEAIQVRAIDNEIFAVVPFWMVIRNRQGTFRYEDSMVGISNDNGVTWRFVSNMKQTSFDGLFPEAAGKVLLSGPGVPTPVDITQ